MSQIESMDQLQAFVKETQEDIHIKSSYFKEGDHDLLRMRKKMDGLVRGFHIPEFSLPTIQGMNLEDLMKDLMKGFSRQGVQVQNSIFTRMKVATYESKIVTTEQL